MDFPKLEAVGINIRLTQNRAIVFNETVKFAREIACHPMVKFRFKNRDMIFYEDCRCKLIDLTTIDMVQSEVIENIIDSLNSQGYNEVLQQLQNLPITSVSSLLCLARIISEKAFHDSPSALVFARLCKSLRRHRIVDHNVTVKPGDKKPVTTFQKVLIAHCNLEFTTTEDEINEKKRQIFAEKNLEMKAMLYEEVTELEKKLTGIITFISELYNMLIFRDHCLTRYCGHFLRLENDQSMEFLCLMLKIIGRRLHSEGEVQQYYWPEKYKQYFEGLAAYATNDDASPEIISMIEELIALKNGSNSAQ